MVRRVNPRIAQAVEPEAITTLIKKPIPMLPGETDSRRNGALTASDHQERKPTSIIHA